MRDLPREPDFVEDRARGLRARRMDQLQRDRGLEHEIVGAPDVAHAAAADARDHPVAAGEHLPGAKHELLGGSPSARPLRGTPAAIRPRRAGPRRRRRPPRRTPAARRAGARAPRETRPSRVGGATSLRSGPRVYYRRPAYSARASCRGCRSRSAPFQSTRTVPRRKRAPRECHPPLPPRAPAQSRQGIQRRCRRLRPGAAGYPGTAPRPRVLPERAGRPARADTAARTPPRARGRRARPVPEGRSTPNLADAVQRRRRDDRQLDPVGQRGVRESRASSAVRRRRSTVVIAAERQCARRPLEREVVAAELETCLNLAAALGRTRPRSHAPPRLPSSTARQLARVVAAGSAACRRWKRSCAALETRPEKTDAPRLPGDAHAASGDLRTPSSSRCHRRRVVVEKREQDTASGGR